MAIQVVLRIMLVVFVTIQEAYAQMPPIALLGCREECGDIPIPYPFGMGAHCSANDNFTITCNDSYTPPRPMLGNTSREVLSISVYSGTISVSNPSIQTEKCGDMSSIFSDNQTRLSWYTHLKCDANNSLCGNNTACDSEIGWCDCKVGYVGNPYTPTGCQDICNPAVQSDYNQNTTRTYQYYGTYYYSSYIGHLCYPHDNKTRAAVIGICSGIGGLILLGVTWWLYKLLQKRKEKKLKEKCFKKNGGLLLQQHISSEGHVERGKLFTSKELEKATDHYNKDRILGQGGQGTVYKGMLTDGRIVAIKKSKIDDESELEPFINEVVILSKIDHRNIVKLHGCCLETEVPLLVYEFIPNGTLFQYIHEQNEDFPLSWDVRVRMAKEVAGALFYLHSSASIPIYHRDIKSTNILLDEKYRAKVADFGTSRSTAIDQTHLTTRVQGTFGYLDPEYFQSSQFTDKSDVYSFGVVLVELLTGEKPILSGRSEDEGRSLATFFILAMKQDRLLDILDPRVMKEGRKEAILEFANLEHRCLKLNGTKRPTMREVALELEGITLSIGATSPHQHYEEVEYAVAELMRPWETTSTSMESFTINSTSTDVEPLLYTASSSKTFDIVSTHCSGKIQKL